MIDAIRIGRVLIGAACFLGLLTGCGAEPTDVETSEDELRGRRCPGAGGGTSNPGTTGPACKDIGALTLSDVRAADLDGGAISPGETGLVHVKLNNTGSTDLWAYPGVRVTTSTPGISLPWGGDAITFGLFANSSWEASVSFNVARNVPRGTTVRFTLNPSLGNSRCQSTQTTNLDVVIR